MIDQITTGLVISFPPHLEEEAIQKCLNIGKSCKLLPDYNNSRRAIYTFYEGTPRDLQAHLEKQSRDTNGIIISITKSDFQPVNNQKDYNLS